MRDKLLPDILFPQQRNQFHMIQHFPIMQCRDNMMRSFLLNKTESIDFSTIKQDQSFPEIEVNQVGDNADPLMILYEKLLS